MAMSISRIVTLGLPLVMSSGITGLRHGSADGNSTPPALDPPANRYHCTQPGTDTRL